MIIIAVLRLWCLNKGMYYMMSCFVTWHDMVLYDTTLYYVMLHVLHGAPYMIPPCHVASHCVIWCHMLHDACCVMWHHLMLYGITLYYAQLTQYVIFKTALHQRRMIISLSAEALGRSCIKFAPVPIKRVIVTLRKLYSI